jgi:hypothetical protein
MGKFKFYRIRLPRLKQKVIVSPTLSSKWREKKNRRMDLKFITSKEKTAREPQFIFLIK